jgi:phage protein U
MADVRVQVAAPATADSSNQARMICGSTTVVLPWWPDEIAWSSLADEWTDIQRPGRHPLVVREGETLQEITLGFTMAKKATTFVGDGGSVLPDLQALNTMSRGDIPVQLMLAARDTGRWRITDFSFTELDHASDGQITKAEVSMTIRRASDASAPVGPVPARKRKPGRRR